MGNWVPMKGVAPIYAPDQYCDPKRQTRQQTCFIVLMPHVLQLRDSAQGPRRLESLVSGSFALAVGREGPHEQRLIHLDAAVVTDKPELAKAIHKKSDVRPCGADHLRQRFLRNGGYEGVPFSRLSELGHQKENPRQTLFAGIEELIDEIGLGPHTAGQQKLEKRSAKAVSSCITRTISFRVI